MRLTPRRGTLIAGCDVVLHFAGVPDPAGARADPAAAVRRERRHDREHAGRLPRARRGPHLSLDGASRRRPAARSLRPFEAARRRGLFSPPRSGDRRASHFRVRARSGRVGESDRRDRDLRGARAGGRADRDRRRSTAHAGFPVRGRPRARARADRRPRAAGTSCLRLAAGFPPRSCGPRSSCARRQARSRRSRRPEEICPQGRTRATKLTVRARG